MCINYYFDHILQIFIHETTLNQHNISLDTYLLEINVLYNVKSWKQPPIYRESIDFFLNTFLFMIDFQNSIRRCALHFFLSLDFSSNSCNKVQIIKVKEVKLEKKRLFQLHSDWVRLKINNQIGEIKGEFAWLISQGCSPYFPQISLIY